MSIEFLRSKNRNTMEKLSQLITEANKVDAPQSLIEEFKQCLHADNDAFMQVDYERNSWQLLSNCINSDQNKPLAAALANVLLDTNVTLFSHHINLLESAATMGNIDIYLAIEKKILENPQQYPALYEELKQKTNLHRMLMSSFHYIKQDGPDFIKMLLKHYQDFYQQGDSGEESLTHILSSRIPLDPGHPYFWELYQSMITLGYQDFNAEDLEAIVKFLIEQKDTKRLAYLLSTGKAIRLADENLLTPQERIQKGETVEDVVNALIEDKFNNDQYLKKIDAIIDELSEIVYNEDDNSPRTPEKMKQLLDDLNELVTPKQYAKHSADLLNECVNQKKSRFANVLLSTEVGLISRGGNSVLNNAATMSQIDIYQAIAKKILDNPQKYPDLHEELKQGKRLYQYIDNALRYLQQDGPDFIKMLLAHHQDFYKQKDFGEQSLTHILSKSTSLDANHPYFWELYQSMITLGYQDFNAEDLEAIVKFLIEQKNTERLAYLLSTGKTIRLADENFLTPQERIQKGETIDDVVNALIEGKFNESYFDEKAYELQKALNDFIYDKADNDPTTLEEFKQLLDKYNKLLSPKQYTKHSADLLNECNNQKKPHFVDLLLNTDLGLICRGGFSVLDNAATMSQIGIYQAIAKKILDNPQKYPDSYEELKQGKRLHQYLRNALLYARSDGIDFVLFLLKEYQDFYAHNRTGFPVNILLESENGLTEEQFQKIDQYMMDLGIQELNFDIDEKKRQDLVTHMIAKKDTKHLLQFLHSGKDIKLLNEENKTPQECLRTGGIDTDIAKALIQNEFDSVVNRFEQSLKAGTLVENFETLMAHIHHDEENTYHIATLMGAFLNNEDQPIAYRKALFEKAYGHLFKSLPIDADVVEDPFKPKKNYDPIHSQFLKYFINHLALHHHFMDTLETTAFGKYERCILDDKDLNEMNIKDLYKEENRKHLSDILFNDLRKTFEKSIMAGFKKRKTPFKQEVLHAVFPSLHTHFLDDIHQMIFIEDMKRDKKTLEVPDEKNQVIYNNDAYLDTSPSDERFQKGQPLQFGNTPIGYNIHLPKGEVNNVIIQIYGGFSKKDREKNAYKPGNLSSFDNYLLNQGTAIITLNLPDLLELEVYQGRMPNTLYQKIHDCIHAFYLTLKNNPEDLHEKIKDLKLNEKPLYLYGASFGGTMTINHAEMAPYQETFDGYISHDGGISVEMEAKSDLPRVAPRYFDPMLDAAQISRMQNIKRPVLLMQNRDDNNVNAKSTLDFYKKMKKINPDLVRLCMTSAGNPIPTKEGDQMDPTNKGHFRPAQKESFIRYCETILNFTQKGPSSLPSMSEWQGYKHDRLANQFYRSGSLQQQFIGHALEIASKQSTRSDNFEPLWENHYKPLYYALHQAKTLSTTPVNFYERPRALQKLYSEIRRLESILTDEMILKTIQAQSLLFAQYMEEMYHVTLPEDIDIMDLIANKEMIQQFRNNLSQLATKNSSYIQHFLSTLYRANPSLLEPFYPGFENDSDLNDALNKSKHKLQKTFVKERKMILNVWKEAKEGVLNLPETQRKILQSKIAKLPQIAHKREEEKKSKPNPSGKA